jgi:phosphohistidine phosphatase
MKTLYIMRHAKSAWGEPGLEDFNRPLLEKGKKRTKTIIDYLLSKQVKPELIISSPAVRALETAHIMAHGLGLNKNDIRFEKSIYTADTEQLEDLFYDLPASLSHLMIVGHNPAVTNFVNDFLENKIDALPTSAVVAIEFNTKKWDDYKKSNHSVKFIIFPKMLNKD